MKAAKIIAIVLVVYVGIVIAFESLLGYFQPANQSTLVITTTDADGASHDRVVARLRSNGQLYVAANHWPRAWFRQTSTNPAVEIEMDGVRSSYTAVPVAGEEHDRVDDDNGLGFVFRVLTGFPPRYFVRLEPR
ncbi:MAG: nitroreductase family deazaflavin-dependent oxidoreductase [Proteobacteria bacterium]|nr:nitroreductase family deazaflavin-dependent oxidoreductase [Pseudomonadota bacterium]MCH8174974.1 nitroreductase family deazaflavin-dependent oxidoreductase [Pseudomonadota bacterium]